jgi:hypothetical protein
MTSATAGGGCGYSYASAALAMLEGLAALPATDHGLAPRSPVDLGGLPGQVRLFVLQVCERSDVHHCHCAASCRHGNTLQLRTLGSKQHWVEALATRGGNGAVAADGALTAQPGSGSRAAAT